MPADFPSSNPSALEGGPVPTGTDASPSSSTGGRKAGLSSTGGGAASTTSSGDTMTRVVQGAHETIDRLAERAAPHVERLKDNLGDANGLMSERADQLSQLADEWAESLRTTVREHPVAAVATALAAGMLIARLTR